MRKLFLVTLLLAVPWALLAQEAPAKSGAPAAPPAPYPPASQYAAPQPGHPLDPADVATLTGRGQTSIPAVYRVPYGAPAPAYFNYSQPAPLFGNRRISAWGSAWVSPLGTQPFFFFPHFGNFRAHPVFVIGGTGTGTPLVIFPARSQSATQMSTPKP